MWKKEKEQICPKIEYRDTEHGRMITACQCTEGDVVLPDDIQGIPVTGIGEYAFARTRVTKIWLPARLSEIGRYAFYRCRDLRGLTLTDSLLEIGGGALTGCRLSEVEIHFYEGKKSCLKSIVDEIRFALRAGLYYHQEDREARVLFPEHYEEAVENTPARLLVTHHHGAGGYYRQCFYNRELDYKKYDELFFRTVAEEENRTAAELALNRLRYPYRLERPAQEVYESYLKRHMEDAAGLLIENEDTKGLAFLASQGFFTEESLDRAVMMAAKQEKVGILSILMDEKHRKYPKKRKTFEL